MTLNIASHFKTQALQNPNRPFLQDDDLVLTHQQLWSAASRLAKALKSLGVRAGDRVVLMQPHDSAGVISLLSGWISGAVVIPLPMQTSAENLVDILVQTRAIALFTTHEVWEALEEALWPIRTCLLHIVRGEEHAQIPNTIYRWEDLIMFSEAGPELAWTQPDDPAAIFFHPDALGRLRRVELTQLNIHYLATRLVNQMWDIQPGDRLLSYPGTNFAFSQLLPIMAAVGGASVEIANETHPAQIIELIDRKQINFALLNNSLSRYLLLHHRDVNQAADFSGLHVTILGSEKLPLQLIEQLQQRYNFRLSTGFSLYDVLPITLTKPGGSTADLRSFGQAVNGTEIEIRDSYGAAVQRYKSGFIFVRGPQINAEMEHFGVPQIVRDGWVNTGQIGYLDESNRLYLTHEIPARFKYKSMAETAPLRPTMAHLQAVYGR